MKSKSELRIVLQNLEKARDIVRNYKELSLIDLGEDDGFDHMADGVCNDIYDAFESLDDAVDGITEMIEEME